MLITVIYAVQSENSFQIKMRVRNAFVNLIGRNVWLWAVSVVPQKPYSWGQRVIQPIPLAREHEKKTTIVKYYANMYSVFIYLLFVEGVTYDIVDWYSN